MLVYMNKRNALFFEIKGVNKVIHTYELNNYQIAIDGNSGSVHVLDEMTYHILKDLNSMPDAKVLVDAYRDQYDLEDILSVHAEIQGLYESGMLFTENDELEKIAKSKKQNKSVKALCLHIAHDCNLKCQYCFASEGDYKSGKSLMSYKVAKKSVDYLVKNSKYRKNIEIDFFGGEPLLNFEVVKKTVFYAKEIEKMCDKRFYFTLTTNGVLLDQEKNEFLNQYVDNVVISIDGRKEIHDQLRPNRAGFGSYDRIVPLTKELVAGRNGKRYFVRGTFTAFNKDFAKDVMHLADLGFKEISIEPVVGSGKDLHFKASDIDCLLNEYENLASQYTQRLADDKSFNFYHFNINVFDGPCLYKRISACGAGGEYLAVSPEGKLYPCHQFVGELDFVVGDVYSGISNKHIGNEFTENTVLTKEACKACWAKLFCSGGCHANAYFSNGDIKIPNDLSCTLQKKRIECAIMVQAWKSEHLML